MRENWLQSSIVGVILFALAMLWLIDIRILIHERSLAGHIGMILLISVTLIVALAFIHIFPLMVHMNLTTFQLFIHTLKLGFVKPWLSLVNLAVFGLLVCGAVLFKWLFLAFFFSVSATVTYWFANRKFKFLMSVSDPSSANQK